MTHVSLQTNRRPGREYIMLAEVWSLFVIIFATIFPVAMIMLNGYMYK